MVYSTGSRFIITREDGDKVEVVLCQVKPFTYCLIALSDGNRWNDPIQFDMQKDFRTEITRKELLSLVDNPSTTIRKIKHA